MTGIGKAGIQRPEDLDDTHGCLGYRFGNIAARRGNSPDRRNRTLTVIRAEASDNAGTLVELGQTGSEVSRITFFTGHLFQTAGHFTKSFCPSGCGVSQNSDIISLIAEVFRNGNTGVNGSLTRCHRHIGGVGNQNRSLHQGFSVARVFQFRELHQNVCHLIAAFAATDVNNNINIRPFCELMLDNRFSRSEGARNCSRAALGNGEHGIDNSLTAVHRAARDKFSGIRPCNSDRPALDHRELMISTFFIRNNSNHIRYGMFALFNNAFYFARYAVGDHDLMKDGCGLLNRAKHVSGDYIVAGFSYRNKFPHLLTVKCRNIDASCNAVT